MEKNRVVYDPDGPLAVTPEIESQLVLAFLESDREVVQAGNAVRLAGMVTHDPGWADHAMACGVPVASAADERTLATQVRSIDDGDPLDVKQAEYLAWLVAVREEEVRNQRAHQHHIDEQARHVEDLTNRLADSARQVEQLSRHISAMEATRAWRVAEWIRKSGARLRGMVTPNRSQD